MFTLITLIALFSVAYLICLTAMLSSMKRSPEGYEDEDGFHLGRNPADLVPVFSADVSEESEQLAA